VLSVLVIRSRNSQDPSNTISSNAQVWNASGANVTVTQSRLHSSLSINCEYIDFSGKPIAYLNFTVISFLAKKQMTLDSKRTSPLWRSTLAHVRPLVGGASPRLRQYQGWQQNQVHERICLPNEARFRQNLSKQTAAPHTKPGIFLKVGILCNHLYVSATEKPARIQ